MNMFVIEKGVPVPPKGRGRGKRESKYPLSQMQPGDSFAVKDCQGVRTRLQSATYRHAATHGGKFAVRKADGLVRVWRTE